MPLLRENKTIIQGAGPGLLRQMCPERKKCRNDLGG